MTSISPACHTSESKIISKLEQPSFQEVQKSTPQSAHKLQNAGIMRQSISSSSKPSVDHNGLERFAPGRQISKLLVMEIGLKFETTVDLEQDDPSLRQEVVTIHPRQAILSSLANTSQALVNNLMANLVKLAGRGPDSAPHRSRTSTPSLVRSDSSKSTSSESTSSRSASSGQNDLTFAIPLEVELAIIPPTSFETEHLGRRVCFKADPP